MTWRTKHTNNAPNSMAAANEIALAYREVFRGKASEPQQQMVLADLAARCGWNQITVPSKRVSSDDLWFQEGMRAAFASIFAHLSLSPQDMMDFDNATRREAALSTKHFE